MTNTQFLRPFDLLLLCISLIMLTTFHSVLAADRIIDYDEWINSASVKQRFYATTIVYSQGFEVVDKAEGKPVKKLQETLPLIPTIYIAVSNYPGLANTSWYKNTSTFIRIQTIGEKIKASIIKLCRWFFPHHSPKVDIVYIYNAAGNMNSQSLIQVHGQPNFGGIKAWLKAAKSHRKVYLAREEKQLKRIAVTAILIGDRFIRALINAN
ncbi:hypothetical protein DFP73DRAFT_616285 [Morchella snyderi]|nr:hypothetical protein DFP73DRAFT_616285 [Morchella snyderi]